MRVFVAGTRIRAVILVGMQMMLRKTRNRSGTWPINGLTQTHMRFDSPMVFHLTDSKSKIRAQRSAVATVW